MADLPVVLTSAGAQPTPPATLLAQLIASVAASTPGYTANLPGSLIEDISSTDVGALVICDAARVETINSLTPFGANDFLLLQLGQIYIGPGAAPAPPTNTSVYVTFTVLDAGSNPLAGYPIPVGFVVSDGTFQYIVQDGGVTDSNGQTQPLFCIATIAGSWAVPTGSVSQVATSAPAETTITCSNPLPGVAAADAETAAQFRARVIQAGQAVSTGTATLLKTLLGNVPGVQQRLVSVVQNSGSWTVIAGGGDPYLTAGAIWDSGLDVSTLVGATLAITAITQENPAEIATANNHNLVDGEEVTFSEIVGMTALNGILPVPVTVVDEKHFTVPINTIGFPAYVSGGIVEPNPINETVGIQDYPDTYGITFVVPPAQTVTMAITYHTVQPNFTSQAAVAQLVAPAIAAYVNSIAVGKPISLLELQIAFAEAITPVLDPALVSSLNFAVSINGVSTPAVGEYVSGDPWSYMTAASSGIAVTAT